MRVVALDLSLTCTGVADSAAPDRPYRIEPHRELRGVPRLYDILTKTMAATEDADLVVIEGYSFHSRDSHAHSLGELGGVVKLGLYCRNRDFVILAPKVRAKLATGKGNAKKELVFASAIRRLGYKGASLDEADALWLLQAALIQYGLSGATDLPQAHLAALQGVQWPAVEVGFV